MRMLMPIAEITPAELRERLDAATAPTLVDVREEGEAAICSIDGSILIPMSSLPQRLASRVGAGNVRWIKE